MWRSFNAICLFSVFLFLVLPAAVRGEPEAASNQEQSAPAEGQDSIETLIRMLREKGILAPGEAEELIERYQPNKLPRKDGRVILVIPEEQERAYMEQVADQVGRELKKDVEQMRLRQDETRDDLMQRDRLAERHRQELEERLTVDVQNQLRKTSWAQRIRWGGDIRLRYQGDHFGEDNAAYLDPAELPDYELLNTDTDRHRGRIRVRLAVKADLIEDTPVNVGKVEVGARLTTGNEDDPVSTNETLGDYFKRDDILLDRAYIKWTYKPTYPVFGAVPQSTLIGGRVPNPFFSTGLVWDSDVAFEGVALDLRSDTLMEHPFKVFLTGGVFPLDEVELESEDKWLYAGQIGFEYKQTMGLSARIGVAYYDFQNITGKVNPSYAPHLNDFTAPPFLQMGNTYMDIGAEEIRPALASDFNELNVTAELVWDYWFPIHVIFLADYVKNLGFDKDEVAARAQNPDLKEKTEGYLLGLKVGYPEMLAFGNWNLGVTYKYLEADAVVDAFTDSDFHLGGTNAQGWIFGGEYALWKRIWLAARWITTDEIEGLPLAVDTLQLDLNAEF